MSPHNVVRVITLAASLLLQSGFAQTTGTPTKPPSGTVGTPGTTPTPTLPSTSPNNTTNNGRTQPGYNPPLYLTGRVVLEDGSPPPEPTTIERICNGQAHAEGYSDSHGSFGIQLGDESAVFQDASETSGRSSIPGLSTGSGSSGTSSPSTAQGTSSAMNTAFSKYQTCELRAKLAGYRSQTINLANIRPLDNPDVGVILLHKDGAETGTLVSTSSLAAPKDARKAYERGMQALKRNKTEEAGKEFEKAVELYPSHAEAWCELGRIQVGRGQTDAARQSFDAALKADPKFVNPYLQLSIMALANKNWPELAEMTNRGMHLDSFDYPQLFLFNAVANYNMHKFELAERSIKQAARLDTQLRFPEIPHLMGLILILHKDYSAAAEQLRTYLKMSPEAEDAASVREKLSEIERITAQSSVTTPKDK